MNKPDKAGEPSMDEILSSIRKIIAEEPIGSRAQSSLNTELTGSFAGAAPSGAESGLSAFPNELGHASAEPNVTSGLSTAGEYRAPREGSDAPGMRDFEPQLPMPGEDKLANRSRLSSRLANALRGDAPSAAIAPETTFDDDDLSAVLGDSSHDIAEVSQPSNNETANGETNGNGIQLPPSALSLASTSEPELIAASDPDPVAEVASVELAAPEPEAAPEATQSVEAQFAPVEEQPAKTNGVHTPLFDAGPQPPAGLRPRAFSDSDIAELPETVADASAAPIDVPEEKDVAALIDGLASDDAASATEGPVVIAAMDDVASEIETPKPVDSSNDANGAASPLVGLAAAVAARQHEPAEQPATEADNAAVEVSEPEIVATEDAVAGEAETMVEDEIVGQSSAAAVEDSAGVPTEAAVTPEADISAGMPSPTVVPAAEPGESSTVTATISPLGVQTLEDTVSELLRPRLREWLADNMPRIVEKALRIEMASSVAQQSKSGQIEDQS